MSSTNSTFENQSSNPRFSAGQGLSGAGFVLASTVVGQFFFFLAQRSILSSISKEENGFISFIFLWCSIVFGILVDSGMQGISLRNAVRNPESLPRILTTIFWIRSTGAVIGIFLMVSYFAVTDTSRILYALAGIAYYLISARTQLLRSTVELPYRSSLRMRTISIITVAEYFFFFLLIRFVITDLHANIVLLCYVIASLPGYLYLSTRREIRHVYKQLPEWNDVKNFLNDIAPITIQMLLLQIHSTIDLLYLNTLGFESIGIIGATSNMVFALSMTYTAISSVTVPLLSQQGDGTAETEFRRITRVFNIVVFIMGVIVMIGSSASSLLILIFSNNRYAGNDGILQLQFFFIALTFIANLSGVIEMTLHERRIMILSGIILILGSMTSIWWMVDVFGLHGYLYSKIWSNGLYVLLFFFVLYRRYSTRHMLRVAIPVMLYSCICIMYVMLVSGNINQWVAMVGGGMIAVVSAYALRLLGKDDLILLRSPFQKVRGMIARSERT
ncbi:MAG: hypothetical protein JNL32_12220 [Candidatus Kapabacteria bacterium]|nr:hypothetical protein [Candidatus Kapabacteria bacterium]